MDLAEVIAQFPHFFAGSPFADAEEHIIILVKNDPAAIMMIGFQRGLGLKKRLQLNNIIAIQFEAGDGCGSSVFYRFSIGDIYPFVSGIIRVERNVQQSALPLVQDFRNSCQFFAGKLIILKNKYFSRSFGNQHPAVGQPYHAPGVLKFVVEFLHGIGRFICRIAIRLLLRCVIIVSGRRSAGAHRRRSKSNKKSVKSDPGPVHIIIMYY